MRRIPEIALLVILAFGCRRPAGDGTAERYVLRVGTATASVEVAADPTQRAAGLSGRREIGEDEGMLFVFPEPGHVSFWMRDTHVPLSIAFITQELEIAEIQHMEPLSDEHHAPGVPVIMALEMPAGWFERNGVSAGAAVELSAEIAALEAR